MSRRRTVPTMCPMSCHPTLCGMRVTVEDDRLLRIEGDPNNPDSRGFLCVRGRAASEIFDNPRRILHPLARRARGEDRWDRIGWDEALDRIADSLRDRDPEQFGIWLGHGDAATNYGTRLGGLLSRRFAHLYGCQWWHPAMICWGLGGFGLGLTGVLEVHTKEDLSANAELIVLWGANIASQPNTAPHIKAARARGARVVTIDVRDSEATARADWVIRIRPGTDAALALALMRVIIDEGLTDDAFIAHHTVGFEALREHLKPYDPQWAAVQTGIPAEEIVRLARCYGQTPRAMIVLGGSSMHKGANGWQGARAIACLPARTGKLGIDGGGLGPRHGANTHGQALNTVLPQSGNACRAPIPNQMSAMTEAFESGRIGALLLSGTDMLSSFADSERLSAALDRVGLVVSHDLFFNDTIRARADIVLPGTAWLEQLGCKMTHTHLYLMDQVLPAPGEAHTLSEILQGLANRLGIEDFFPWESDEGFIDAVIAHPASGHATVAALRTEGAQREMAISHRAHPDHRFPTPSGKIELYSERAAEFGLPPLPVYAPPASARDFPLQFRQGRTLTHFHGFYDHGQALPTLSRRGGRPTLWISAEDAAARGITNDSTIRIFNRRGEMNAWARVTGKITSGTVWMRDGWSGINRLTSGAPCLPDSAVDAFSFSAGQAAFDAQVDVEPAPAS